MAVSHLRCIPVLLPYSMLLGLQKAQITYEEKVPTSVAEIMKLHLAWKIHELEDLQELLRKLLVEISILMGKIESPHYDRVQITLQGRSIQFESKCWMQLRGI